LNFDILTKFLDKIKFARRERYLCEQAEKRLKNVHVEAKETENGVAFLHKVIDGPTDKSYGINVASLAGLPKSLIERSKQILNKLEEDNNTNNSVTLDLFNFDEYDSKPEIVEESKAEKIKKALDEVDVNRISPLDALNILNMLKEI
jgi:DNA mismatch repair protein MutS